MRSEIVGRALMHLALLACVGLTLWGLAQQEWPQALPWGGIPALRDYLALLAGSAVLIAGGASWSRIDPIHAGALLAGAIALASGALWPLLVVVWFFVSSYLVGAWCLARLGEQREGGAHIAVLVGAGTYGTLVGLMAHFPINYPGIYGALLAAPLLLGRHRIKGAISTLRAHLAQTRLQARSGVAWWLACAVAVVGIVHFVVALFPEVGFDALAMHLFVPAHLALRHEWGFDPELYVWAVMPMLGDWLLSVVYMLGGEQSARLLNVGFLIVLLAIVRDLVRWGGGEEKGVGWAVLLLLSTPLIFTETNTVFVDIIWTAYVAVGAALVLESIAEPTEGGAVRRWALAGAMFGLALQTKLGSLSLMGILLVLSIYRWRWGAFKETKATLWVALLLACALGSVPYVTAWLITENPVFPFFNAVFKSPYYPVVNFDNALFKSGVTWDLIYKITFESGKYLEASNGAPGFQWLLLLIPASIYLLLAREYKSWWLLIFGVSVVVVTFQAQSYLRYILPAFVFLAAFLGTYLSKFQGRTGVSGGVASVVAIAAVGLNLVFLPSGTWAYRNLPFETLVSATHRDQYLDARLPARRAVDLVNVLNKGQTPVAILGAPFGAGLAADALYPNWYNHRFNGAVGAVTGPQGVADVMADYGADYVLLDAGWGDAKVRAHVEEATEKVAEFGSLTVRNIRKTYRYKIELLKNPDLQEATAAWSLTPGARFDESARALMVTVTSPAYQLVNVKPGRHYVNSVEARCDSGGAQGRVQINWLNASNELISADIRVFDCSTEFDSYSQEVVAPSSARYGLVYAVSHGEKPVWVRSVSLR